MLWAKHAMAWVIIGALNKQRIVKIGLEERLTLDYKSLKRICI